MSVVSTLDLLHFGELVVGALVPFLGVGALVPFLGAPFLGAPFLGPAFLGPVFLAGARRRTVPLGF